MSWDISHNGTQLTVKLRNNWDILHVQIKKQNENVVQNLGFTHLEAFSLQNIVCIDKIPDNAYKVSWTMHNARRRLDITYQKQAQGIQFNVYRHREQNFELSQSVTLTMSEYSKFIDVFNEEIVPSIRTVYTETSAESLDKTHELLSETAISP